MVLHARNLRTLALMAVLFGFGRTAAVAADGFRFSLVSELAGEGFTPVAPHTVYSPGRGYGFEPGADGLTNPTAPRCFSVAVPEGNYRVTLTFGAADAATTNTVKAESRRLMLEQVVTRPGEWVTRSFTVNVRTPEIPGGDRVRLKDRERGVLHWDEKLTLEFNGARPGVARVVMEPVTNAITVFLLGDSTVTDQPHEPWASWGQMLPRFFQPGVAVANHAESGESLKSSLAARRVAKVLASVRPGDYVLIQFGHNDQKDRATNALAVFETNLRQLVVAVRARGATPVLVTSMERKAGLNGNTLAGYPDTVRRVAAQEHTALIDLHAMSLRLYRALGADLDRAFQDGTHHNNYGAYLLAQCVAQGLRDHQLPLAEKLSADFAGFDPERPAAWTTLLVPASPLYSAVKPEGN
jgi:lysophospholipase L1-like esterase